MNKCLEKLQILEDNVSVSFYSPLQEKSEILTRTGCIADGSCFFHCILRACSSKYPYMDTDEKKKYVKKIRQKLSDKITKENWEKFGITSIVKFQENISIILINFYKFLDNDINISGKLTQNVLNKLLDKKGEKIELYRVITNLIKLDDFEKHILPNAYKNNTNISQIKKLIKQETVLFFQELPILKEISPEKIIKLQQIIENFLDIIMDESEIFSFNSFKNDIKQSSVYIDNYLLQLISEHLNLDIYFIDEKTRMPYYIMSEDCIKNRKSIVLLWLNDNHYETIGILKCMNIIKRTFDPTHHLIKKIKMCLFNRTDINSVYPELSQFLN